MSIQFLIVGNNHALWKCEFGRGLFSLQWYQVPLLGRRGERRLGQFLSAFRTFLLPGEASWPAPGWWLSTRGAPLGLIPLPSLARYFMPAWARVEGRLGAGPCLAWLIPEFLARRLSSVCATACSRDPRFSLPGNVLLVGLDWGGEESGRWSASLTTSWLTWCLSLFSVFPFHRSLVLPVPSLGVPRWVESVFCFHTSDWTSVPPAQENPHLSFLPPTSHSWNFTTVGLSSPAVQMFSL